MPPQLLAVSLASPLRVLSSKGESCKGCRRAVGGALCAVVGKGNGHQGALGKWVALVYRTKVVRELAATVLLLRKRLAGLQRK